MTAKEKIVHLLVIREGQVLSECVAKTTSTTSNSSIENFLFKNEYQDLYVSQCSRSEGMGGRFLY